MNTPDSSDDKVFSSFDDMGVKPVEDNKMHFKLAMQQKVAKAYKRAFGDEITFYQLEKDVVDRPFFTPKNNNGKKKFCFDYLNFLKGEGVPLDPKQTSFHEQYGGEKEERDLVFDSQIKRESIRKNYRLLLLKNMRNIAIQKAVSGVLLI